MYTTHVSAVPLEADLVHLPVGRSIAPSDDRLHVMDGDGASLCEIIDGKDLLQVYELQWRDVPISRRCGACRALMHVYTASAG